MDCFSYDINRYTCTTFRFLCFFHWVLFHSRVTIEPCPVTTDLVRRLDVKTTTTTTTTYVAQTLFLSTVEMEIGEQSHGLGMQTKNTAKLERRSDYFINRLRRSPIIQKMFSPIIGIPYYLDYRGTRLRE